MVVGAILIYGDKDVLVAEYGRDTEESGKEVRNDVERIVEVDGKEILVLFVGEIGAADVQVVIVGGDTQKGANPRAIGRRGESYQRSIAVEDLLDVEWLGIAGALFCVVGREGGQEFEDALALGRSWEGNLLASPLRARRNVAAAPTGRGRLKWL